MVYKTFCKMPCKWLMQELGGAMSAREKGWNKRVLAAQTAVDDEEKDDGDMNVGDTGMGIN